MTEQRQTVTIVNKRGLHARASAKFVGAVSALPEGAVVKVAKDGNQTKLIRFGQQGVKGSPKRKGESEANRKRRESWKKRHASNIKKGRMSAAWWASKTKW